MNEETFNLSIRKFLKMVGVSSQREIEQAVAKAVARRRSRDLVPGDDDARDSRPEARRQVRRQDRPRLNDVAPNDHRRRRSLPLPRRSLAARAPGADGAARRDRRASARRDADLARAGPVHGAPRPADRRAPRDRDRRLHRLQRADGRARAARRRPAARLRRQRRVHARRPALLAAGRRRAQDRPAARAGASDPRRAARRGRGGQLRLRLHRCRQGELRRLLRALPAAAAPGRIDRDRQHACGAARWRTRPRATRTPRALQALNAKLHGDARVDVSLFPSATD